MSQALMRPVRLEEYEPPAWQIDSVDLIFDLDPARTIVTSTLELASEAGGNLRLDGESLELLSLSIDGEAASANRYVVDDHGLTIHDVPRESRLEIVTATTPSSNKSGEGLFVLRNKMATQCEAEGFRKLTYFIDRPDVLAKYRVKLVGSKTAFPHLLSNGNLVAAGELDGDRHWAEWVDPFPKPCYIFAVMAGDWEVIRDSVMTGSGRTLNLAIYADPQYIDQCDFAMGALKRALAWEEATFGLEYDLDDYNIVALSDHMGAMENKGLNLFEAHGIVANPMTTTDDEYMLLERILAHEVFHNWTGNRVTCRDWFQLSIKEGLTRFRDQLFSADMALGEYKRIDQVKALRRNQFPEDAGPAAHPVQPKEYFEIRNFYTATVYEKGAEVVRMLYHLLGRDTFINAVRFYLNTYDLQAVTKEEFVSSLETVSGLSLKDFVEWYDQPGRPIVSVETHYDADAKVFELEMTQRNCLASQIDQSPQQIPIVTGLVGPDGVEISQHTLDFKQKQQTFRFENIAVRPVPSLLRGFSAPITLESDLTDDDLAHLMSFDSDAFTRWDSAQQLGVRVIRRLAKCWRNEEPLELPAFYLKAFAKALADEATDLAVRSELIRIPDEPVLSDGLDWIDLDAHVAARNYVVRALSEANLPDLSEHYTMNHRADDSEIEPGDFARRRFKNACLELLVLVGKNQYLDLALAQVKNAANMTDEFDALSFLANISCPQRDAALDHFYAKWEQEPRALDKWFMVQALSRAEDTVDRVLELEQHPLRTAGGAPRSWWFYGSFFRQNRVMFHDPAGRGYEFLVDKLLELDPIKPGVSMRFMPQILQWRRYDEHRQSLMKSALERLAAGENISRGLYENVTKALS